MGDRAKLNRTRLVLRCQTPASFCIQLKVLLFSSRRKQSQLLFIDLEKKQILIRVCANLDQGLRYDIDHKDRQVKMSYLVLRKGEH